MNLLPIEIVEYRRTTITVTEANRIAVERIRAICGLQGATHIDVQGMLCREDEIPAGGHSWFETVVIRQATTLDVAAFAVLNAFDS